MKLGFKYYNQRNEICFKKQDDDLYISSTKSPYTRDILALLGNGLSALYDEFIQLSNFRKLFIYDIASNSKFLVNISKYDYDCNSNIVLSTIQGKENEIFKRIFIRIDGCPEWCKQTLYQIRQEQLLKGKRLDLKRKLFPRINKIC